MNDINRDKMIEKLKKLFALGQSSNQHEAELALAKASELMLEYQISETDVDLHDIGDYGADYLVVEGTNGPRHYVWMLAEACAQLFDCTAANVMRGAAKHKIVFFGPQKDLPAAKMLFEHLWKSWQSIVKFDMESYKKQWEEARAFNDPDHEPWGRGDTMKFKHGHGMGFAAAVFKRVKALVQARKETVATVSTTGRDLVILKDARMKEFLENRGVKESKGSEVSAGSYAGRQKGAAAGEAVPLGGISQQQAAMIAKG